MVVTIVGFERATSRQRQSHEDTMPRSVCVIRVTLVSVTTVTVWLSLSSVRLWGWGVIGPDPWESLTDWLSESESVTVRDSHRVSHWLSHSVSVSQSLSVTTERNFVSFYILSTFTRPHETLRIALKQNELIGYNIWRRYPGLRQMFG